MRRLLAGGLLLSAGLWVANARAGEIPAPNTQEAGDLPSISLGRPVALDASASKAPAPIKDRQLQPATFSYPTLGRAEPLFRAQSPDNVQVLPVGPPLDAGTGATIKPGEPSDNKQGGSSDAPSKKSSAPDKPDVSESRSTPLPAPRLMPVPPGGAIPGRVSDDCSTTCADDCCDPCVDSCPLWRRPLAWLFQPGNCENTPPYCVWFNSEYLLWAIKDARLPALVTSSPAGTPRSMAGVLGAPGTTTLFGNDSIDMEARSGARFTLGVWFDPNQTVGLQGSGFFLGDRTVNFTAGSPGMPILARPFVDATTGLEASELVAFPGVISGAVVVRAESQFHGADLDLRANLWNGCCWRFDLLGGVRYLGLDESLLIAENLTAGPASGGLAGSNIAVTDSFLTHNTFWGGELGMDFELKRGRWSFDILGKVALGDTREVVKINGSTSLQAPMGMPTVSMGGLLAQPTNIGNFSRDRFAVAPEAGVKVGYQVTDWMKLSVGYTFLYLSDVARPGNQIDRVVNTTQLPSQLGGGMLVGPPRPSFVFKGTDFWAQGLTVGLELRY
jgi:hypothetical protein